jgi:SAM-dependent methyltransferase
MDKHYDKKVISDFGDEWSKFSWLNPEELEDLRIQFKSYSYPIEDLLKKNSELIICDFGAGSGRWSHFLLPYCKNLYILEPAEQAFKVIQKRFKESASIVLLNEEISENSISVNSLDLAVALGVLHHIPNPKQALADISSKLKPGGTLLCYIYYSLENRPIYYKMIWNLTDVLRKKITNLPFRLKYIVCNLIALLIYFPLARVNGVLIKFGIVVKNWPLSHYSNLTYKVMRNDALDRFGTKIEYRFSKEQITQMLIYANFDLSSINFSPNEPYWTFSARKL